GPGLPGGPGLRCDGAGPPHGHAPRPAGPAALRAGGGPVRVLPGPQPSPRPDAGVLAVLSADGALPGRIARLVGRRAPPPRGGGRGAYGLVPGGLLVELVRPGRVRARRSGPAVRHPGGPTPVPGGGRGRAVAAALLPRRGSAAGC